MAFVPYPPPPKMNGTVDNPGRQPTPLQAIGMVAGFVLLVAVLVAFSVGSATAELVAVSGAAGLILGVVAHTIASRPRVTARR